MKVTYFPLGAEQENVLRAVAEMIGMPTSRREEPDTILYSWEQAKGAPINVILARDLVNGRTRALRLYVLDNTGLVVTFSETIKMGPK